MKFNKVQKPILWDAAVNIKLPADKNELAFYSVEQLAYLIKNKKISSLELTTFFIDRIKKFGDTLQCVISLQEDLAFAQAKQADADIAAGKYRGQLHGIPYGLKDLFAVKDTKTTWGAAPYKDQIIQEDAFVYQKMKAAGAVLVAKFTLESKLWLIGFFCRIYLCYCCRACSICNRHRDLGQYCVTSYHLWRNRA
jgi:hypothetical protein